VGGVAEASIDMPVRRTHVQLAASAILSAMKVGVVSNLVSSRWLLGFAPSVFRGGVLDVVMNVGGFGQTEEQLVVQSETRVYAGFAFMLLGTITQVALCLKKKQYERWKTPLVYPTHGVRIGCNAKNLTRVSLAGRVDLARGRV